MSSEPRGLYKDTDSHLLDFVDERGGGDLWDNKSGSRWTLWMGDRSLRNALEDDSKMCLVVPLEYLR